LQSTFSNKVALTCVEGEVEGVFLTVKLDRAT